MNSFLEEIENEYWDNPEDLDDDENSDNEDLDSSSVSLTRKGDTHDLMKQVSHFKNRMSLMS